MRVRKLTWKEKTVEYGGEYIYPIGSGRFRWSIQNNQTFDDSDVDWGITNSRAAARAEIDERVKEE